MQEKMPGYLCIFAFLLQMPIWYIYLFAHQPEGKVLASAIQQLKFTFNTNEPHLTQFVFLAISPIILIACAYLFLATKHHMLAMIVVGAHAAVAFFYFGWIHAIGVALPLLYLRNELRRT